MKQLYCLLALFVLFSSNGFSQHHDQKKNIKTSGKTSGRFIPVADYKKLYKKEPDYSNPSNYLVIKGDTLIPIDDSRFKTVNFEYKDENFLKVYKKVAFNNYSKGKDGKAYMLYWKSKLKIYMSDNISSSSQKNFKKFAQEISSGIDSLKITFVKNINEANYVIYTNGDFEYHSELTQKEGDYYIHWKNSKINRGFIKIDRKAYFNETLFDQKLKELFIQTLGYFQLTDQLHCKSFFSSCHDPNKEFGTLDKEILKYHYSYGICKGINEETFDNLHQKAKEHKKNHPDVPYRISHVD